MQQDMIGHGNEIRSAVKSQSYRLNKVKLGSKVSSDCKTIIVDEIAYDEAKRMLVYRGFKLKKDGSEYKFPRREPIFQCCVVCIENV